jgi:hypothetical protein
MAIVSIHAQLVSEHHRDFNLSLTRLSSRGAMMATFVGHIKAGLQSVEPRRIGHQ